MVTPLGLTKRVTLDDRVFHELAMESYRDSGFYLSDEDAGYPHMAFQ